MTTKRATKILVATIVALVVGSGAAQAQTFLQQVFANVQRVYQLDVVNSAEFAVTVMWNRQDTDLLASMVCQGVGDPLDWAVSFPLQERVLRMDVGVFDGMTCLISIFSPKTAAFALNLVERDDDGNLSKSGGNRIRDVTDEIALGTVPAKALARLGELRETALRMQAAKRAKTGL